MNHLLSTSMIDREGALKLAKRRFRGRLSSSPRSFVSLAQLNASEAARIVQDGLRIKADPAIVEDRLRGRSIAMLFEKPSTRTRSSFDAAAHQIGGSGVIYV